MNTTPRAAVSAAILLTLLAAAAALPPARAETPAPELDLDACIAEAVASSDAMRSSRFRRLAAEARADGAGAERWPTLGVQAGYDYASEVTSIDIPFGPSPRTIEFGDGNTYRVAVGVDVPVYLGGSLAAASRAARAEAGAAARDVAADSLAVVRDVRAAYYRALASRAQRDAALVAVRRLERHLDVVRDAIDVGTASEEERVQVIARLRGAEQRMLAAEMERATDEIALATAVGRPGERVAPSGNLDSPLVGALPEESAVASRPELAALDARRRSSNYRARAAFGSLLPSVTASAYYNYGRPGVDPVQNEWMSWASARVGLAWTFFDRGARSDRVESARATARALAATRDDLHRRMTGAFESAKVRLEYARRQAAKAGERVEAETRRFALVGSRRDEGMATETELLDAHDDLADAEASEVSARVAVRLAEAELLYAAGR